MKGITPFTLAFGEGMTEERLLGGIDMPLFQKTGKVQYLLENSFIDHEYVVFEELFDAPVNVLLTLKDILTSKKVRNGTQVRDVKCRLIVACTNRSAEEVGTDLSSKALLERFPLRLEVKWDDYSEKSFLDLINIVTDSTLDNVDKSFLAKVFALHHERGYFISPRTAVHAVQVFKECGIHSLKYIGDINADVLQEAVSQYDKIKQVALQKEQLNEILKKTKSICDSKADVVGKIKSLKDIKKEIAKISFYDENAGDYKSLTELVNNSIQRYVNEL